MVDQGQISWQGQGQSAMGRESEKSVKMDIKYWYNKVCTSTFMSTVQYLYIPVHCTVICISSILPSYVQFYLITN